MNDIKLFACKGDNNEDIWVTKENLVSAMRQIGAADCSLLFIHTDISNFGRPNPELRRKRLLQEIWDTVLQLQVKNIMLPAFTFSFANSEAFDVNNSSAKYMGALNEYVRKQSGTVRSLDPLMSVITLGEDAEQFYHVGKRCMGEGGIFSLLHTFPEVKFLFLGADPKMCFTYSHYVEAVYGVPYRFEQWYTGAVIDRDGHAYEDSYSIFAACKGVVPAAMRPVENQLRAKKCFQSVQVGAAQVTCFREEDAYQAVWNALEENIYGFLTKPFTQADLQHTVKPATGRIVMVP